jgi:flagellar secretion chaperone FliS
MSSSAQRASAASAYLEQDVRTADPLQLLVRIFDVAVAQVGQARAALATGDPSAKARAVDRVSRCIGVLHGSLDMERGAEVSKNLDRLYGYLQHRLTMAHLRNDDRLFEEIASHLQELGSAWREAASSRAREVAVDGVR